MGSSSAIRRSWEEAEERANGGGGAMGGMGGGYGSPAPAAAWGGGGGGGTGMGMGMGGAASSYQRTGTSQDEEFARKLQAHVAVRSKVTSPERQPEELDKM